jgi:hypothetical protein
MKTTIAVCNVDNQAKAVIEELGGSIHIARTISGPILHITLVTLPEGTYIGPWKSDASKYDICLFHSKRKVHLALHTHCDYTQTSLVYVGSKG